MSQVIKKKVGGIGRLSALITIFDRNIETPTFDNSVSADLLFTNPRKRWARVEPIKGTTLFDNINTERVFDTKIFIRYDDQLTSENWIEYLNFRYEITPGGIENIDNEFRYLLLRCINVGNISKDASKA